MIPPAALPAREDACGSLDAICWPTAPVTPPAAPPINPASSPIPPAICSPEDDGSKFMFSPRTAWRAAFGSPRPIAFVMPPANCSMMRGPSRYSETGIPSSRACNSTVALAFAPSSLLERLIGSSKPKSPDNLSAAFSSKLRSSTPC